MTTDLKKSNFNIFSFSNFKKKVSGDWSNRSVLNVVLYLVASIDRDRTILFH